LNAHSLSSGLFLREQAFFHLTDFVDRTFSSSASRVIASRIAFVRFNPVFSEIRASIRKCAALRRTLIEISLAIL
jgi:hypothetical protein